MMNSKRILAETLVDFDNRTCENCEFYINNMNHVGCHFGFNTDCGGCNKFKRKDKHNVQHGDRLDKVYYGNKNNE